MWYWEEVQLGWYDATLLLSQYWVLCHLVQRRSVERGKKPGIPMMLRPHPQLHGLQLRSVTPHEIFWD